MTSRELDSMILMGLFQLEIFYDSYKQNKNLSYKTYSSTLMVKSILFSLLGDILFPLHVTIFLPTI